MKSASTIAWRDWLLTAARAAIHRPTGTVIVSDLHLGYAEARRRTGEAIPAPSVAEALFPLHVLLRQHEPASLILAGDLFEAGPDSLVLEQLLGWLESAKLKSVTVLAGNHDRGLRSVPPLLRPAAEPVRVGEWQVVHGDQQRPEGAVVQGHLHPALRPVPGLPLVPCFLAREEHLVLPAFSVEAAGVDLGRQPAFVGHRCFAIVGEDVLEVRKGEPVTFVPGSPDQITDTSGATNRAWKRRG
jgi:uncharacterized protein